MQSLRKRGFGAAIAAVGLGVLVAAGCGSDEQGAAAGGGGGQHKITLIIGVKGDAFYSSMTCGAQQAAKKLGVDLDVQGPDKWDPSLQTPVLNAVVAKKPDAILIAPNDAKAMYAPLKQAEAEGIKIVLVDTTLEDPSLAVAEVTSDNEAAGGLAAKEVARQAGKDGAVLTVDVSPGISTTEARVKGFQATAEQEGFQDLGVQYTGDDPAKASGAVTATLARHPDLAGVFATNTLTGEGAATGLREAGKAGNVKLIGFDANPSGVQALEQGVAQAQVVLKPLDIGYEGVTQAVNALEGKPVEKKVLTGSVIANKGNVSDPEVSKYLYSESCES